jgi:hypothetical protein
MRRLMIPILVLACATLQTAEALALGSDHSKEEIAQRGPNCVHGFWVNEQDVFFYAGDAASFSKFVEEAAKQNQTVVRVILHPGAKRARSPWDKEDRDIPADWSVLTGGTRAKDNVAETRIDVWLGGRIKLDQLRIPANVDVVSGGEIERFIADRKKAKE